ncbi:AAA family ATPase [Plesiomonas sp. PI-19]|uniref:AAA family ATPase n=1 Tax=Plesiomonas sp. PI-19 TaxID=2898798 RepID=UPI001F29A4FE|nr:ATP-binding protein [Plesiomonas sp. PI-19]MCE5164302.1 AAA family ATPase [Plesiomonas sp. PI-19]
MHITHLYLNGVGPLVQSPIELKDHWRGGAHSQVLFTGPNGCGKSTVLRAIAMLWEAAGWWIDQQKALPQNHVARAWLQRWEGIIIIFDQLAPFTHQPVGLLFGNAEWIGSVKAEHPNVAWIGETVAKTGKPGKPKRELQLPADDWMHELTAERRRMLLSYDKVDVPNIIYLDAEERRWVNPKRNVGSPEPDLLSQRWLTRYLVNDDWKGQLEPSLIALKTTQLHKFHEVLRNLNLFLQGKEIESDIAPGENRLSVKIKGQRGVRHSLDELSAGEHQVLILVYLISRWLQPGGIVLIDEPDLYLHPSLVSGLLANLERLVAGKQGQLILTSHSIDIWQRYEQQGLRIELQGAWA